MITLHLLDVIVLMGGDLDSRTPRLVAIDNIDHGLNPRLAQALMRRICDAVVEGKRQSNPIYEVRGLTAELVG